MPASAFHGIAEMTATTGLTAPFVLNSKVPLKAHVGARFADGTEITYAVSNGAKSEWRRGVYSANDNTLSRGSLIDSTTGADIDWGAGYKMVSIGGNLPIGMDFDGATLNVASSFARLGQTDYPANYFNAGPNTYLFMDRGDYLSDATVVFRGGSANGTAPARAEIGLLGHDDPNQADDFHIKLVTGEYLSETFTDRMIIHNNGGPADFYNGPLRQFANSGTAMFVIGNSNGLLFPDSTGDGLEISYNLDASLARITAITHDLFYRDIVYEANNHRWWTGPVFLLDAMRLNQDGALILANPVQLANTAAVSNAGGAGVALMSGYVPGTDVLTAVGGTGTAPTFTVTHTQVSRVNSINAAGAGGTPGSVVLTTAAGTGTAAQINATIGAGGTLSAVGTFVTHGDFTVNPGTLTAVPVTGGGLTGAKLNLSMGALTLTKTTNGAFTAAPNTPVSTTSSGAGTGATLDIHYQNGLGSANALEYWANGHKVIDNAGNWLGGSILSGGAGSFIGLTVDNGAGNAGVVTYKDGGTNKFAIFKATDNSFALYDYAHALNALYVGTSGAMQVGETGSTVTLPGLIADVGFFSKVHASITGIGASLEAIYQTGAVAPTINTGAIQGFVSIDTPPGAPNNQSVNFFVGALFTAQATTHNNGVGTLTLTATAATAATTLQVSSIAGVRNGDVIYVTLDNGEIFSTAVNGSPSGSNIPILPALPSAAASGNNVYDYSGEVQGLIASGQLKVGATNWFGAVGIEANNTLVAGSSVFFKCLVHASNNFDDVVQADGPWDMMFGASGQPNSIGAKAGLGFGPWSGVHPVQETGTLIKTFGVAIVANGVDISSYIITGNAWKSDGCNIDGAGQVNSTNVVSTGVLRTTGPEDSQVQMVNGGQEWHLNSQSSGGGGGFYLYDVTNSKSPLSISPNATASVNIAGDAVLITGKLDIAKRTSSGTAPGAGVAKFEVVAGTSAGTAKLIMYAGTSATPTTIVDNVGAGF